MSDDPHALAQAYADHAAMAASDDDWLHAAEQYEAAANVCRTEDRRLRQAALTPERVPQRLLDEPLVCICAEPHPNLDGACKRCHRLIQEQL